MALVATAVPAAAQEAERRIEVVDLRGVLDDRAAGFVLDAIRDAGRSGAVEVVVVQVDAPGVVASADRLQELAAVVADPPVPLVFWVGPEPARAFGGVAQLLALAPLRAAAPGVEIGYVEPTLAGGDGPVLASGFGEDLRTGVVRVDGPISGLVDETVPSLRQLLQALDGRRMEVGGRDVVLSTVRPFVGPDGQEGVTVLPTVIR